jgi:hypothetical protein
MSLNRDVARVNRMSDGEPPPVGVIIGIILATVVFAGGIFFCGLYYARRNRKKEQIPEQIPATPPPDYPWQTYDPVQPPASYDYNYYLTPANMPAYPSPQSYNDAYYIYPYAYQYCNVNTHSMQGNFSANAGIA